jgi:hypothetical protein
MWFWSISLYNAKGFFEKNDLNAYSLNSLTAKPNADGSFTIQFGGCQKVTPNCLPTMAGTPRDSTTRARKSSTQSGNSRRRSR